MLPLLPVVSKKLILNNILSNNYLHILRKKSTRYLTLNNMNPHIKAMRYDIEGPVLLRAREIEEELEEGAQKPFKEVIKAHQGDSQAIGQKPITFIRQVIALVAHPPLLEDPNFPDDAKERACAILNDCAGNSVGSYTDSPGLEVVRKDVAKYIADRDGIPCDWENVILCPGASSGVKSVLKLLNNPENGVRPGIMTPIPQYPLYAAAIEELNMHQINYYLKEEKHWALDPNELNRAIREDEKKSIPRAIVVINPGNPTGQVLTKENIEEIIKFAYENKLFILSDEVYQHNVYAKCSKFYSFKKVLMEMGEPYNKMELASFMSISKGFMGECGLRAGFTEIVNMDPHVKNMFLKSISIMLCPNVLGQAALDAAINPPKPNQPSYCLFMKEKNYILDHYKKRAKMIVKTFNKFHGLKCNDVQGAMYAFPNIKLSPKAIEAAKKVNQLPDVFYCFKLLESTGMCVVPGSGFGQQPGTYHFRTTILPPTHKLKVMLKNFEKFHEKFSKQYS